MIIKFEFADDAAVLPAYATEGAAGFDLCASEFCTIQPHGSWGLVSTGLRVQIPQGYEGQIRSRSGLALKRGVSVMNSPGTIDSDYRGVIGVILQNHSADEFVIKPGDRIAQMVIAKVERPALERTITPLSQTVRSNGGFGSTGV
jgi:dUTP pyrophosphatase